jgi:CRP-like cAMP-binding protein
MDVHDIQAKALRSTPFFAELSPEDLEGVLRVGRSATFRPEETIVGQGDAGDGMYIVESGVAEVDVGGRFHRLGPGDFFGEMALITSSRRMATVKAVEPVAALKIPAEDFRSFLLEHPSVAISMLKALVDRLREVEQRLDAWMAS